MYVYKVFLWEGSMKDRGKVICSDSETQEEAVLRGKNRLNKDKMEPGFPVGYCYIFDKYNSNIKSMVNGFFVVYGKMSGKVSRRAKFLIDFVNKVERII